MAGGPLGFPNYGGALLAMILLMHENPISKRRAD
jgi:hypothetical protein